MPVLRAPGITTVIYSCPPAVGNGIIFFSREISSAAREPEGWQPAALPAPAALKSKLQCATDLKLAPPLTPQNNKMSWLSGGAPCDGCVPHPWYPAVVGRGC